MTMNEPRVVVVVLRTPRADPNEMRTDPLWEVGSFGCTGCHRANLMNPRKLAGLNGARLAFAQNGPLGFKLVHLTPPVRILHHGSFSEAKWFPTKMPLSYASAPTLVNNLGFSDVPNLLNMICDVRRSSPVARFASKFRSRRMPLPRLIGERMIAVYDRARSDGGVAAKSYVDALPWLPPRVDDDRKATYRRLLRKSAIVSAAPHDVTRCRISIEMHRRRRPSCA
jgi:hypothetical protein